MNADVARTAIAALAIAFPLGLAVEQMQAPAGTRRPTWSGLPGRLVGTALLLVAWTAFCDRVWLGAAATIITQGVLAYISTNKERLIGEPLVVSDFGLIRLAIRFPELYYTDAVRTPCARIGFVALFGVLAAWCGVEPPILPLAEWAWFAIGLAIVAALVWLVSARAPLAGLLRGLLPDAQPRRDIARFGLVLTLLLHGLRWRAERRLPYPVPAHPTIRIAAGPRPDLVVVVQLESFMDPTRLDPPGAPLPGLAAARARALMWGRLRVPAHGAYTMRSEFSVLTGLSPEDVGFRAYDPYLSSALRGAVTPPTLATRLGTAGFRTLFVHPFFPGFFDRAKVLARLGFTSFLWNRDFAPGDRVGPYVGDVALARRLLREVETAGPASPLFAMAVTMENHGPWPDGRLPDGTGARAQYLVHLANSDRAIATLIDGLSDHPGRVLLCLYGDHPPILPDIAPSAEPETDYVLLVLGTDAPAVAPEERTLTADELGRIVMALSAPDASGAAPRA